mmetsp:Transcript_924/g.1499  ORF Transcript_924/g.1499 Transcript_924/m.1499 type:complete len:245 (-) Transcript_924:33-767(-)
MCLLLLLLLFEPRRSSCHIPLLLGDGHLQLKLVLEQTVDSKMILQHPYIVDIGHILLVLRNVRAQAHVSGHIVRKTRVQRTLGLHGQRQGRSLGRLKLLKGGVMGLGDAGSARHGVGVHVVHANAMRTAQDVAPDELGPLALANHFLAQLWIIPAEELVVETPDVRSRRQSDEFPPAQLAREACVLDDAAGPALALAIVLGQDLLQELLSLVNAEASAVGQPRNGALVRRIREDFHELPTVVAR